MSYTSTGGLPTIPRLAVAGVDEGAPGSASSSSGSSSGSSDPLTLTPRVTPAAPASGLKLYADATGKLSWIRASDGFTRTFEVTATANRTFTIPDASFTLAGQNLANTFTLANTFSANGALSAPAVSFTGTPTTGGSASTTVGLVKIGSGASGNLSTSGTMLEVQAPAAFSGNLLHLGVDGASARLSLTSAGVLTAGNNIQTAGNIRLTADNSALTIGLANDVSVTRKAAANLQLGSADAAAPVAQTLGVQSVVAGTSNTAGANFTIKGSTGTGTGTGGSILFQTAPAGSTGTAQNAFSTAMTIAGSGAITFPVSGTLSAPAVSFTGTPITGGSATTTAPLIKIGSGADGDYSTSGNMCVVNAPPAYAGYLQQWLVNGSQRVMIDCVNGTAGRINISRRSSSTLTGTIHGVDYAGTGDGLQINYGGGSTSRLALESGQIQISGNFVSQSGNTIGWSDVFLSRKAAANLQLGATDAAAPVQQTLSVQSVVAGTSNTTGAAFTIKGSAGTGTGAGGSLIFQVAPAGSTGSSQNSFSTAMTIASTGTVTINNSGLTTGGSISIPAGSAYYWNSRSVVRSSADSQLTLLNSAETSFDRLNFGGTTSSFPALKRSTTTLQAVLADDSGFAATQSLYDRFGSGTPEGAVTAPVGAVYHRTDGGAGTSFYVKESGSGNTGWVAK